MNPSEKDVNARYLLRWSRERMKKELEKCRCLCSNCHSEVHERIYLYGGNGFEISQKEVEDKINRE